MTRSLSELHEQIVRGDQDAIAEFVNPLLPRLVAVSAEVLGDVSATDWRVDSSNSTQPGSHKTRQLDGVRKAFATIICRAALGRNQAARDIADQCCGQPAEVGGEVVANALPLGEFNQLCKKWLELLDVPARRIAILALAGYTQEEIVGDVSWSIAEVQQALENIQRTWGRRLDGEVDTTIVLDDRTVGEAAEVKPRSPRSKDSTEKVMEDTQDLRVNLLGGMKPFCDLPLSVVTAIAEKLVVREYAEGQVLLRQGESSEQLIVLVDGEVDVTVVDELGTSHTIGRGVRRAVLGEISLLTGQPHSATVVAASQVRSLVLSAVECRQITARMPTLGVGFADVIEERLGRMDFDALFGKEVHGYRINQRLGRGGMAIVYEGHEVTSGRQVALKMMRHPLAYEPRSVERFLHEAQVVASLEHPNILRTYECFADYNTFFIVMQFCPGPTLRAVTERSGPLEEKDARPILGQLAAGLSFAHAQGVVHRDVKPANVLFDGEGALRLSDFGLARSQMSSGLTQQSALIGTPSYMAPEQLVGETVDHHADIFAYGCLTFELLAGRKLFRETSLLRLISRQPILAARAIDDLRAEREDLNDPLSDEVVEILRSSLALNPDDRDTNLDAIAQWIGPIKPDLLQTS